MTDWPADPEYDWPQRFTAGDFVRLDDGRPALIRIVLDYAPSAPARWELVVSAADSDGNPDDFIVEPWQCRPDSTAATELADQGIG